MKKLTAICILALMMLLACLPLASANVQSTLQKVDGNRILFTKPEGMAAQVTKADGMLSIVVNTEETDWEKLLLYTYEPTVGTLLIGMGFEAPDGRDDLLCLTTGATYDPAFQTEQEMIDILSELQVYDTPSVRSEANNGSEIARYVADSGLLKPLPRTDDAIIASWFYPDGTLYRHEILRVSITYTSTSTMYEDLPKTPASRIVKSGFIQKDNDGNPLYLNLSNPSALTTRIANGSIRYEAASRSALDNARNLYALVSAPQKIEGDVRDIAVRIGSVGGNFGEENVLHAGETIAGYTLTHPAVLVSLDRIKDEEIAEDTRLIEWRDAEGNVEVTQLFMQAVLGDPRPVPYYTDWTPLASNRITFLGKNLSSIVGGQTISVNGVEISLPEEGWLHIGVDENHLPTGQQMLAMDFTPYITPPNDQVTHYSWNNSSANDIFGGGNADSFTQTQEEIVNNREEHKPIPESRTVKLMSLDPVASFKQDDMTVFLPSGMTGEYAGGIQAIFWYNSATPDAEPIKEFFVNTQDSDRFARVEKTPALNQGSTPNQLIELPVIVLGGSLSGRNLWLSIELYPQTGETSVYYELCLKDENGKPVSLRGESCQLYLPYPRDGRGNPISDAPFVIRHYNDYSIDMPGHLFEDEAFFHDGNGQSRIERTPHGLKITVNSLSPFSLSWGESGGSTPGGSICMPGHHDLRYKAHDYVLEESCTRCDHVSVLLIRMEDAYLEGDPIDHELERREMDWMGENQDGAYPKMLFYDKNMKPVSGSPKTPGQYFAAIEGGDARAVYPFTVVAKQLPLPQTGDSSLPLALLAFVCAASTLTLWALRKRSHA